MKRPYEYDTEQCRISIDDIVPLIGYGNYNLDVPLARLDEEIGLYIEEFNLQLQPNFQRAHVWSEQQQKSFVEFILRGGKCNPILFNHAGWMRGDVTSDFVLVDGLQRLTALRRFLQGDLPVFEGNIFIYQIERIRTLLLSTYVRFHVNDLKSRDDVLRWYLQLNAAGTQHTDDELDKVRKLLEQEQKRD